MPAKSKAQTAEIPTATWKDISLLKEQDEQVVIAAKRDALKKHAVDEVVPQGEIEAVLIQKHPKNKRKSLIESVKGVVTEAEQAVNGAVESAIGAVKHVFGQEETAEEEEEEPPVKKAKKAVKKSASKKKAAAVKGKVSVPSTKTKQNFDTVVEEVSKTVQRAASAKNLKQGATSVATNVKKGAQKTAKAVAKKVPTKKQAKSLIEVAEDNVEDMAEAVSDKASKVVKAVKRKVPAVKAKANKAKKQLEDAVEEQTAKKNKNDEQQEKEEDDAEEVDYGVQSQKESTSKKSAGSKNQSQGKLQEGDTVDGELVVVDEQGESHKLEQLWSEGGIVVFMYPKANTPGCQKQATGFKNNHDTFVEKGYTVYGLSADTSKAQSSWKTKNDFPYGLLSDLSKDRATLKALGVNKAPGSISRSHIIINNEGVVEQVAYGVTPQGSVDSACEFVASK